MSASRDRAQLAALAYHEGRARRDVARTIQHVADEVLVDGPGGRSAGVLALVDRLQHDFLSLERTDLIAVFAQTGGALLLHHDQTLTHAGLIATRLTVEDGQITRLSLGQGRLSRCASSTISPSGPRT